MSALNLLVFRGSQRRIWGHELKARLVSQLERLNDGPSTHGPSTEGLVSALLLAGELECGTADADSAMWRSTALITDRVADALVSEKTGKSVSDLQSLTIAARSISVPGQLSISTPEGFAYYALHPLAYAEALERIFMPENNVPKNNVPENNLVIVGIRSIGSTLSAVTAAAARLRGMQVRRFTVRPEGHPYNRRTELLPSQLGIVQNAVFSGAMFVIVDEGPGLSGSSFLSVAEALEQAGVPSQKIVLLGSHEPKIDSLCASDAARRWRRFRYVAVAAEARQPVEAEDFIGGGLWRSRLFNSESDWPASWISLERLKYLSSVEQGEPRLYKFAGLGHYGDQVVEREKKVAESGFGPTPQRESDGFVSYPWIKVSETAGRAMVANDPLSPGILARMAEYCAFRLRTFSTELSDLNALQQMAEHNLRELGLEATTKLQLAHPVIADGHMQPHEWLLAKDGRLLKTDSGSHGDDHFFPGPTDIAWDLAGAIVEWHMDREQTRKFLNLYCAASGDDASARIDGFTQAYLAFRAAYCLMAANAMAGSDEQSRLEQAAAGYKAMLEKGAVRGMAAA